jgi:hypothetical protein
VKNKLKTVNRALSAPAPKADEKEEKNGLCWHFALWIRILRKQHAHGYKKAAFQLRQGGLVPARIQGVAGNKKP